MILGMPAAVFLAVHVALSLLGIGSGLIFALAIVGGSLPGAITAIFLATTVLTNLTGFPLPPPGLDPPRIVGLISLAALAVAIAALYAFRLRGAWRWVFVVSAILPLYLNSFVGVIQAFQKLSFLQPLAPTQSEPPFVITQLVVLAFFVVLGILALRRLHPRLR